MTDKYTKILKKEDYKTNLKASKEMHKKGVEKENHWAKEGWKKKTAEGQEVKTMVKKIQQLEKKKSGIINEDNKHGNIVDVRNLNKYYTNGYIFTHALKKLTFEIKRGEIIVLLGQSGSGKTTLLNMISGLDTITEGDVIVANNALHNMKEKQLLQFRRMHTGFVFQQYNLMPNLTALENVEIGGYLQKDPEKKLSAEDLLTEVGLGEHIDKYPRELSGGQQQRVSICRALAKNPEILFADEPTGALDEESGKQVLKVLMDVNVKKKTTLVIVTHNSDVARLADRVFHVKNGVIESIKENKTRGSVESIKW